MPRVEYEQLRENYKRCCEGSAPKPKMMAVLIGEQVGLCDKYGKPYLREDGFPQLNPDRKKRVSDFSVRDVTEAILGPRWEDVLGLNTQGSQFPLRRIVREEATAAIGPSHFLNVSAWTATIGGLIQAQTLEGYETADFDLTNLFPTRPVVFWQGGERLVNIIGPSKMAPKVGPGESHPNARMDGMWVQPGPVDKYGQKILITKETAYIDITGGQILGRAREVGESLRFRENDLSANAITGVTNNFQLGLTADSAATGYNTYGATVPIGLGQTGTLGNDLVNPMVDPFTTLQASDTALLQYRHPVTGVTMPMANKLSTILLPSSLQNYADFMLGLAELRLGNNPAAPAPQIGGTTFPTGWMTGQNPFRGRFKSVLTSQWLFDKHVRSATVVDPDIPTGQGLSVTNANRWYRLDPATFAARRAAWEMTMIDLSPNDYVMADQGIVAGHVGNIAVMVQVLNPWAIQRNKVS